MASKAEAPPREYRYQQEISQMLFVFGEVTEPHPDLLKVVEDIVRTQVVEMLIQSRRLAQRRGSRGLSPEDVIFLIRYDRAKVNRLRTFLSWKDVRKNAKDSDANAGPAAEGEMDEVAAVDNPAKAHKRTIKLPWELAAMYGEHLHNAKNDDADEPDEDDLEAHEDSLARLREADEATRRMTKDEYVFYSECRQASFTFKKAKRFREFINAGTYLDVKPNDDIIDTLGFLAFEVVRELCVGAIKVKDAHDEDLCADDSALMDDATAAAAADNSTVSQEENAAVGVGTGSKRPASENLEPNETSKRHRISTTANSTTNPTTAATAAVVAPRRPATLSDGSSSGGFCSLFAPATERSRPLMPSHVHAAFAKMQQSRAALAIARGSSGSGGGLRRLPVVVI